MIDLTTMAYEDTLALEKMADLALARMNFKDYCWTVEPDFYQDHRHHLVKLCMTLNAFFYRLPLDHTGQIYHGLIIEMPPQHGKTRTLVNFTDWAFGKDPRHRVITGSYNDDTASDFSRYARDGITKIKLDPDDIVFSDIFPHIRMKRGQSAITKWALEGQHFNYLGAGIGGSVTSKGATIRIVDDLIKSAQEALSDTSNKRAWSFYADTFMSRRAAEQPDEGVLDIIVGTPWSKQDVAAQVMKKQPKKWFRLSMPAYDEETGEMLCEDFLTYEEYLETKKIMSHEIFMANYNMKRIDIKGRLYTDLKTYTRFPTSDTGHILFEQIKSYTDTADQGSDYLCSIIYGIYHGFAYVIDVYYTKQGMEVTEGETARRLAKYKTDLAVIESNSGGRSFARAVRDKLAAMKNARTVIRWFHQSKNKRARIISNSAAVMEFVLFPVDWEHRWPEFFEHVNGYLKEGTGQIDDGPDALTGVIERTRINQVEIMK